MKNIGKKILVFFLALMPCFQTQLMASTGDEPDQIPLKPDPNPNPYPNPHPGGPRARSRARNTIEVAPSCFYYDGEVSIEAGSNVAFISATVTRLDDNMQWSDSSVGNTLLMSVSTESGTYLLNLTLSDGRSFYGEYSLY